MQTLWDPLSFLTQACQLASTVGGATGPQIALNQADAIWIVSSHSDLRSTDQICTHYRVSLVSYGTVLLASLRIFHFEAFKRRASASLRRLNRLLLRRSCQHVHVLSRSMRPSIRHCYFVFLCFTFPSCEALEVCLSVDTLCQVRVGRYHPEGDCCASEY